MINSIADCWSPLFAQILVIHGRILACMNQKYFCGIHHVVFPCSTGQSISYLAVYLLYLYILCSFGGGALQDFSRCIVEPAWLRNVLLQNLHSFIKNQYESSQLFEMPIFFFLVETSFSVSWRNHIFLFFCHIATWRDWYILVKTNKIWFGFRWSPVQFHYYHQISNVRHTQSQKY